jgi:hypothetical protein
VSYPAIDIGDNFYTVPVEYIDGIPLYNGEQLVVEFIRSGDKGELTPWIHINSNYQANNRDQILANTYAGTFTITLPSNPIPGWEVVIGDGGVRSQSFYTNNVLVVSPDQTIADDWTELDVDLGNTITFFLFDGTTWQVEATAGPQGITGATGPDGNPPGTILTFAGSATPAGYIVCDGSAVSRSYYPNLFTAIGTTYGAGNGSTTFNVPDLRGEFIRGLDLSRGVDAGRALGTYQSGTVGPHQHNFNDVWTIEPDADAGTNLDGSVSPPARDVNGDQAIYALYKYDFSNVEENRIRPTEDQSEDGGSNDNRIWTIPNRTDSTGTSIVTDTIARNMAMLYIIKY